MDNNLQHHGILGMKWGVRRYQNRDGTLTKAGKKRYDKEMEKLKKEERVLKGKQRTQAKLDKLEAKRKEIEELKRATSDKKKDEDADTSRVLPTKKSIKNMSDDDLKSLYNRLDMEKKVADLSKKDVSAGRRFVNSVAKDIVVTAALDVGKQLGKSFLTGLANKAFKLDDTEYKVYTNNKKKN